MSDSVKPGGVFERYSIYPFAVVAAFYMSLLAGNFGEISTVYLKDYLLAFTLSLGVCGLLWFVLRKLTGSLVFASMLTLLLVVILLFSGSFFQAIQNGVDLGLFSLATKKMGKFLLGEAIIVGLWVFLLFRMKDKLGGLHRFLNFFAVALLVIGAVNLAGQAFSGGKSHPAEGGKNTGKATVVVDKAAYPDIYYIILDGYANETVLKKILNYDNGEFIAALEKRGFYVAHESTSNYAQTGLSLPSALNYRYLDELQDVGSKSERSDIIHELFNNNAVMTTLKEHGYKTVNFSTSWGLTQNIASADINVQCGSMNEFQFMLLKQSIAGLFMDKLNTSRRQYILCPFERLPKMAELESPKFFFAHILAPHLPYLFDRNGKFIEDTASLDVTAVPKEDPKKYVDQLIFINAKVLTLVDEIAAKSKKPPIIIIQSDHGSSSLFRSKAHWDHPTDKMLNERMRNFSACLVPASIKQKLYPAMTPVNSFRLVFGVLFGMDLPLLPDKALYSSYFAGHRLEPRDVSEVVKGPLL